MFLRVSHVIIRNEVVKFVLKCLFKSHRCYILKLIQFFQSILNEHPFHVDSLLQLSEICKMGEDLQVIMIEIYWLKIKVKNLLFDPKLQADNSRTCTEHVGWDVWPIQTKSILNCPFYLFTTDYQTKTFLYLTFCLNVFKSLSDVGRVDRACALLDGIGVSPAFQFGSWVL